MGGLRIKIGGIIMNYEKIIADVEECLDKHEWYYRDSQVRKTVDRWLEAKGGVINLLRKHPGWDEDALAVVFDYDSIREVNILTYQVSIDELIRIMRLNNYDPITIENFYYITSKHSVCCQFVTEEMRQHFAKYDIKTVVGTKASKVLGRYFRSIALDKLEGYNHHYAMLADSLNPLSIKRFSLLSVHPCDYLNMSQGTGWDSCHNIDDGCYMVGTLSYMTDECSMIFYTVDKSYSGNSNYFWNEPKINRQVYAYHHNALLQSRLYPNCNDVDNYDNFRNAVQKIFADVLDMPNYWTLTKGWNNLRDKGVCTYDGAKHYPDYEYNEYNANLSVLRGKETEEFYIGSPAYCIDCGEQLTQSEKLNCCGRYECEECGEYADDIMVGGKHYCSDCVTECADCGYYHVNSDMLEVNRSGRHVMICESCANHHYISCEICGELFHKDSNDIRIYTLNHDERGTVCIQCATAAVLESLKAQVGEVA